jgi:hypothetical protein
LDIKNADGREHKGAPDLLAESGGNDDIAHADDTDAELGQDDAPDEKWTVEAVEAGGETEEPSLDGREDGGGGRRRGRKRRRVSGVSQAGGTAVAAEMMDVEMTLAADVEAERARDPDGEMASLLLALGHQRQVNEEALEVKLGTLAPTQVTAYRRAVDDHATLFLTGGAGTGKTYLLRCIIDGLRLSGRTVAVLAPTGVAAHHIGGATLHSFLKLAPQWYNRSIHAVLQHLKKHPDKMMRYRVVNTIVVDEVSMVSDKNLDWFDLILKQARDSTEAFGGVQFIVCGDFYQLPPVAPAPPMPASGAHTAAAAPSVSALSRAAAAAASAASGSAAIHPDDLLSIRTDAAIRAVLAGEERRRAQLREGVTRGYPMTWVERTRLDELAASAAAAIAAKKRAQSTRRPYGAHPQALPNSRPRGSDGPVMTSVAAGGRNDDPTGGVAFVREEAPFAFRSAVWRAVFTPDRCVQLTECFRQRDPTFIGLLNRARIGQFSSEDLATLSDRHARTAARRHAESRDARWNRGASNNVPGGATGGGGGAGGGLMEGEVGRESGYMDAFRVCLYSRRDQVEKENDDSVTRLSRRATRGAREYHLTQVLEPWDDRQVAKIEEQRTWFMKNKHHLKPDKRVIYAELLADYLVELQESEDKLRHQLTQLRLSDKIEMRIGTRVMLTKNWQTQQGLVHGRTGFVVGFGESGPRVLFDDAGVNWGDAENLQANLSKAIEIPPLEWSERCKEGRLTVTQIPLSLSWAITIHKSQGLSMAAADIDLGHCFEAGQAYVALSRVTTLEQLGIINFKPENVFASIAVRHFYSTAFPADTPVIAPHLACVAQHIARPPPPPPLPPPPLPPTHPGRSSVSRSLSVARSISSDDALSAPLVSLWRAARTTGAGTMAIQMPVLGGPARSPSGPCPPRSPSASISIPRETSNAPALALLAAKHARRQDAPFGQPIDAIKHGHGQGDGHPNPLVPIAPLAAAAAFESFTNHVAGTRETSHPTATPEQTSRHAATHVESSNHAAETSRHTAAPEQTSRHAATPVESSNHAASPAEASLPALVAEPGFHGSGGSRQGPNVAISAAISGGEAATAATAGASATMVLATPAVDVAARVGAGGAVRVFGERRTALAQRYLETFGRSSINKFKINSIAAGIRAPFLDDLAMIAPTSYMPATRSVTPNRPDRPDRSDRPPVLGTVVAHARTAVRPSMSAQVQEIPQTLPGAAIAADALPVRPQRRFPLPAVPVFPHQT